MFGDAAPTLMAPTGARTTLSYAATPPEVCTVNAMSGALTFVGVGTCAITATAEGTANYDEATAAAAVTVQPAGALTLNLDPIARDDTVNIAEKAAGFMITGDTGTEGGVTVSVTIGSQSPLTTTSAAGGAWVVNVPANAAYITGTGVTVTVSAVKIGSTSPLDATRELAVDLTAPSATYLEPLFLTVGVAIADLAPNTSATDIDSFRASNLPSGLVIDAGTGVISGTPDAADDPATATVTVTDTAGNPGPVSIPFPAVFMGEQTLMDFRYNPATVAFGDRAPIVIPPTGAQTALSYLATPTDVCTVNATSGALTLVGVGDCVVTATAERDANYNLATAGFTVTVQKGEQTLMGFGYRPATVMFGSAAPTLIAPTGARTTVSYSATPAAVCTVDTTSGALTLVGAGTCTITATAEPDAYYNEATADFDVTVQPAGTLALNVDPVAGDDTVNIAEKTAGFPISGDTGSEAGVTVSVTIGSQSPLTETSAANGAWVVSVPAECGLPHRHQRDGDGKRQQVRLDLPGPRDADAHPGPERPVGELPRAGHLAVWRAHRRPHAEHHRHRHRLVHRDGPAVGPEHRRHDRRHHRHPGHRQPRHRDRHGGGDRHRRQPRHRLDRLPRGVQG